MRFVSKVSVVLVMVPVLLQATGDSALGASNCGFLTIEQCRATSAASVDFACPINFTILKGLTKGHKRQEVCAYAMPYDPYPSLYSDPGGIKTLGNIIKTSRQ